MRRLEHDGANHSQSSHTHIKTPSHHGHAIVFRLLQNKPPTLHIPEDLGLKNQAWELDLGGLSAYFNHLRIPLFVLCAYQHNLVCYTEKACMIFSLLFYIHRVVTLPADLGA
jgi:hypothetical protein